jgi:predicted PurR-regulated permease PerM
MNTLVHADIFFFITTIAVVFLTILLILVLLYMVKTARTVSQIVEKIRSESDQVIEDLADLREKIKDSGSHISSFGKWLLTMVFGKAVASTFGSRSSRKSAKSKTRKVDIEFDSMDTE